MGGAGGGGGEDNLSANNRKYNVKTTFKNTVIKISLITRI